MCMNYVVLLELVHYWKQFVYSILLQFNYCSEGKESLEIRALKLLLALGTVGLCSGVCWSQWDYTARQTLLPEFPKDCYGTRF